MSHMVTGEIAHKASGVAPIPSAPRTTLVIGYGNTLRGDDAVGPRVVAAVAAWQRPGVLALAVQQLTPELAEALAGAELAVFVDACPAPEGEEVRVRCLEPANSTFALGHASDPRHLLGLAQTLYGWSPPAWWVLVPGASFELGEGLSAVAARGVEMALREIGLLIERHEDQHEDPCTKSA